MQRRARDPPKAPTTSGSSTTRWARSGSPPTPCGGRRPSGRSRTSRSRAAAIERAPDRARWPGSRAAAARSTPSSACSTQDVADAIAAAADEVARRRARRRTSRSTSSRPARARRAQHERQRGHRHAGDRARSGATCTPTTTSTPPVVATTSSRRRSTSPPPRRVVDDLHPGAATTSPQRSRRKADEFADVVKSGRTHLMDATPVTLGQEFGGYAAAGPARRRAARGVAAPGRASCRSAAPRSAPGINTPPGFAAARDRRAGRRRPACRCTEARDHFEAQGARDALVELSGAAAHHRRRPDQDLQRPALDGLRARAPGWPRSACPTCSPGRRSCPARSTRCSPRRR